MGKIKKMKVKGNGKNFCCLVMCQGQVRIDVLVVQGDSHPLITEEPIGLPL